MNLDKNFTEIDIEEQILVMGGGSVIVAKTLWKKAAPYAKELLKTVINDIIYESAKSLTRNVDSIMMGSDALTRRDYETYLYAGQVHGCRNMCGEHRYM